VSIGAKATEITPHCAAGLVGRKWERYYDTVPGELADAAGIRRRHPVLLLMTGKSRVFPISWRTLPHPPGQGLEIDILEARVRCLSNVPVRMYNEKVSDLVRVHDRRRVDPEAERFVTTWT